MHNYISYQGEQSYIEIFPVYLIFTGFKTAIVWDQHPAGKSVNISKLSEQRVIPGGDGGEVEVVNLLFENCIEIKDIVL